MRLCGLAAPGPLTLLHGAFRRWQHGRSWWGTRRSQDPPRLNSSTEATMCGPRWTPVLRRVGGCSTAATTDATRSSTRLLRPALRQIAVATARCTPRRCSRDTSPRGCGEMQAYQRLGLPSSGGPSPSRRQAFNATIASTSIRAPSGSAARHQGGRVVGHPARFRCHGLSSWTRFDPRPLPSGSHQKRSSPSSRPIDAKQGRTDARAALRSSAGELRCGCAPRLGRPRPCTAVRDISSS